MIHLDKQHYYSLEGIPGKLQTVLLKGKDLARQISYSQGNHLICRISRLVGCYFVLLLTLPFTILGTLINRIFREKIDKELFKREFELWDKIFYDYMRAGTNRLTDTQDLITTLVKKRQKASDCPFNHILLHVASKNISSNLFCPGDGLAHQFTKFINAGEKCLVIFCPQENEKRSYKKLLKISSNLPIAQALAKNYLRQNEFEHFADPEKLKNVSWMWLSNTNQISSNKLKIFSQSI